MRSLLIFLVVMGSLPVTLIKPHVGIWMWSWISYMNPHRISWGISDGLPLAQIVGLATIAGWLICREPKRLPMTSVTVLLILYTIWISITTVFALNPEAAYGKWEQSMKILFMTFMTMALITKRERLHVLIWVIVVSIGIYGVNGGIFTILTGGQFRVFGPTRSFMADNNALALAMVMILPLMRYIQLNTNRWYVHWGMYGAMGLTFFAILGTYSRGGFLALSAMGATLIFRSRHKFLILAVLAPVVAFGFNFVPQQWYDRMYTIETFEEDNSAQGRLRVWRSALNLAADRPIGGGGFNVFWSSKIMQKYQSSSDAGEGVGKGAHSIYFEVLGEHGYVGLAIFLSLGAGAVLMGSGIIRRTRDRPELIWAHDLASMIQAGLIGYAAAGAFQNLATFDLYYHYLAIMVMIRHIVATAPAAEPGPQDAARGIDMVARPVRSAPLLAGDGNRDKRQPVS